MKTLIIVAHPQIDDSSTQSFLHAGADLVENATWHPLPATFDVPVERAALLDAERVILQFPLYWYQAPSRLADWLNAVWSLNFAKKMAAKQLGVVLSLGRPKRDYQPGAMVGVTVSELLAPYRALANVAKMTWLAPLVVAQFNRMAEPDRKSLLVRYQQYLSMANSSFAAQTAWWQQQLAMRPEAQVLADALSQRADQLASLQQALKEADDD